MSIWKEIADFFYCGKTVEGMELFMNNVASLGQQAATSVVNPLFDALEHGDFYYAADLLRFEIAVK